MSKFIHRFFISILSVVIFSALVAGFQYMFISEGELGYGLLLGIYSFYTAPFFILAGIPATYLLDYILKKHKQMITTSLHAYIRSFSMYGITGIIIAMIYSAITSISKGNYFFTLGESLMAITVGISAAAVYFHISLLLQINWEKLKKQQESQEQKAM